MLSLLMVPTVSQATANSRSVAGGASDSQDTDMHEQSGEVGRGLGTPADPRDIVNRDTRGVAKIVAERDSGRVLGIHLLAEGASDAILAGVYALEANFTVDQLATAWTPYLTMAEAIKLTAQSFSRDVAALSCCAS